MARSIIWSDQSLQDIENIAEYISKDSKYHAQRVVSEIFELVELIAHQSNIGRIVPELNRSEIREQFVYSYRVIYQIEDESIVILSVIHGSRLLDEIKDVR